MKKLRIFEPLCQLEYKINYFCSLNWVIPFGCTCTWTAVHDLHCFRHFFGIFVFFIWFQQNFWINFRFRQALLVYDVLFNNKGDLRWFEGEKNLLKHVLGIGINGEKKSGWGANIYIFSLKYFACSLLLS